LVRNQGDEPVVVRVRYSDWTLDDQGAINLLPAGSCPATLSGIVEFEPQEFSLGRGETGRIHVTMKMPADGPATRWGVILSEIRPADPARLALGPRAIGELGTTLYLTRAPASPVRADFSRMSVIPLGHDSISVAVRIANAGERHFYVTGSVSVRDSS